MLQYRSSFRHKTCRSLRSTFFVFVVVVVVFDDDDDDDADTDDEVVVLLGDNYNVVFLPVADSDHN